MSAVEFLENTRLLGPDDARGRSKAGCFQLADSAAQEHFASMHVECHDKPAEMARHPSTGVGLFL
jgi:hypothetical protein